MSVMYSWPRVYIIYNIIIDGTWVVCYVLILTLEYTNMSNNTFILSLPFEPGLRNVSFDLENLYTTCFIFIACFILCLNEMKVT